MEKTKDNASPVGSWIIIVVCFLLGVLDMIMLRDAIRILMRMSGMESSLIAFCLATVANFTALMWGRETGKHLKEKSINKYSVVNFLIWLTIGIFYFLLRVAKILTTDFNNDIKLIIGEVVQIFILAILYTSTGLTISAEARKIFDRDVSEYRRLKKEFERSTNDLASESAAIQEEIGILKKYRDFYISLDEQRQKINTSIYKAEESAMSDIVGKTIAAHPEITPHEAHLVLEQVLKKRDILNEKLQTKKF